jgi:hypothetical protein
MKYLIILLLLATSSFACLNLENGMHIINSTQICNDVFYLDQGVTINQSNITIDCAGAILQGKYKGSAFYISNTENIIIKNCRIVNYDSAFLVDNSSQVFLQDNHLIRNFVGTTLIQTTNSGLFNYDVSLKQPLIIINSQDNMISAPNKFFEGEYCDFNYCNRPRSVVESYRCPRNTQAQFSKWFLELFKKSNFRNILNLA